MDRPWFQFYTRDWLDNKELRRCSPTARAVLVDLLCLAHEGVVYGFLEDKMGPLTDEFMASRCMVNVRVFRSAFLELVKAERIHESEIDVGRFFVKRMVQDEKTRLLRAAGGHKGGNPNLSPKVIDKVNLPSNLTSECKVNRPLARAHVPRSEGDSGSVSVFVSSEEIRKGRIAEVLAGALDPGDKRLTVEELETAWERHRKHRNDQPMVNVFRMVHAQNGTLDTAKFRLRHPRWCEYWERKGWQFCSLTLWEWVEAGMPEPPPEVKNEKRSWKDDIE